MKRFASGSRVEEVGIGGVAVAEAVDEAVRLFVVEQVVPFPVVVVQGRGEGGRLVLLDRYGGGERGVVVLEDPIWRGEGFCTLPSTS